MGGAAARAVKAALLTRGAGRNKRKRFRLHFGVAVFLSGVILTIVGYIKTIL